MLSLPTHIPDRPNRAFQKTKDDMLAISFGLHAEQSSVNSFDPEKLLMAAHLRYPPGVDHDDPVGHSNRGKSMRNQNRHLAFRQLFEALKNLIFRLRIQGCGGLVEYQNLRIAHEGARQRDSLPLTERQLMSSVKPATERCVIALRKFFDDRLGAALTRRADDFIHLVRRLDLAKANVFSRFFMRPHGFVQDNTNVSSRIERVALSNIDAVKKNDARGGIVQPG